MTATRTSGSGFIDPRHGSRVLDWLAADVARDDRLAEGDVAQAVGAGRARILALDDAGVEALQLALEGFLVRRRLDRLPRARGADLAAFEGQPRRRVAEEGRGERQGGPPLRSVERELHRVAGDPVLEIDPC